MAFAVALDPLLLADFDDIFHAEALHVVDTDAAVHVLWLPSYSNVPVTVTVHKTVLPLLTFVVLVPVTLYVALFFSSLSTVSITDSIIKVSEEKE